MVSVSACHGGDKPERAREDRGGKRGGRCCLSNKSEMLMQ